MGHFKPPTASCRQDDIDILLVRDSTGVTDDDGAVSFGTAGAISADTASSTTSSQSMPFISRPSRSAWITPPLPISTPAKGVILSSPPS
jgi:uncharacterized protein (DUF1684 family)